MNGKCLTLATMISLGMFFLWALESCSKNNNTTTYQSEGTMTATINGASFTASSYVIGDYTAAFNGIIVQGETINGKDTTGLQIEIPYTVPVNQPISVDSSTYIGEIGIDYQTAGKQYEAYSGLFSSHGTITLTTADTVNHRVIGTFSGVLYNYLNSSDSVVLTNGAFNSTYQVQ